MEAEPAQIAQVLYNLGNCGPQGRAALDFLETHKTRLGFHTQPTGARWTLRGGIQLHPRYTRGAADDPYALSLIVHEVRHLQQGMLTALSVYGELDAWQLQFSTLKDLCGRYDLDPERGRLIAELMALPLNWDRSALQRARLLMRAFAGKRYRIDLLPLYPLPAEMLFWIARHPPGGVSGHPKEQ
jgi:hypothetical protein